MTKATVLVAFLLIAVSASAHGQAAATVRVAVIDTGCQYDHAALAAKVDRAAGWTAPWLLNPHVGLGQDDSGMSGGHGTKVCGIVAGAARTTNGAPLGMGGASAIIPIKAFSHTLQCADVAGPDVDGMAAAIRYAADVGARLVNISCTSVLYSQAIQDAIDYGASRGTLYVVAAGNTGTYDDGVYPTGARENMLVVGGAVTGQDGQVRPWSQSTRSRYVDVMAAPLGTISTACVTDFAGSGQQPCSVVRDGEAVYAAGSGTSFAAPLVLLTALAMLEANPALTNAQLEQIIADTAGPIADCVMGCGAGYLRHAEAVAAAARVPTPTPAPSPCWPPKAKRCR